MSLLSSRKIVAVSVMSFFFDKQSMASAMDELSVADISGSDDGRSSSCSTSSWDILDSTTSAPRDIASANEDVRLVKDMVKSEEACPASAVGNSAPQTWYGSRNSTALVAIHGRNEECFTSIFDLLNLPRNASIPTVSHVFRMVSSESVAVKKNLRFTSSDIASTAEPHCSIDCQGVDFYSLGCQGILGPQD